MDYTREKTPAGPSVYIKGRAGYWSRAELGWQLKRATRRRRCGSLDTYYYLRSGLRHFLKRLTMRDGKRRARGCVYADPERKCLMPRKVKDARAS